MGFIESVIQTVQTNKRSIVLPEGNEPRNVCAAAEILQKGFAHITLLGDESEIKSVAAKEGVNVDCAQCINPKTAPMLDELVQLVVQLRAHKGMDSAKARELLTNDVLYFGSALVKAGKVDGMVSGAVHSTADVMRAALQIVGTASDCKLVSSFMVMEIPQCAFGLNGTFIFADPGLCPSPNSEELAHIAIASAKNFKTLFKSEPIVALLSHSTYGSSKHTDALKIVEAAKIAKNLTAEFLIDGELQLDAAIIPEVGKSKAKDSKVAGRANVLIFPDLDAGNIGYKLVERLAGAKAYGPITQGLAAPINDLSRGCKASDIVGVVAITALQASSKS
ncbi:MAG: phosphate acetyltransferase [Helicobacter sp.]|nr:phosphate acetyltransferase [Helicobacter sp.]